MMVIEYFYYKKKYLWCKIMWKIRVKSVYNMSINVVKYPVIGGRKAHRKFTEYCIHLLIWTSGMKDESFFFLITVLQTFWTHGLIFKMKKYV